MDFDAVKKHLVDIATLHPKKIIDTFFEKQSRQSEGDGTLEFTDIP